jgi:conjugative transfer signal peptidase TraF
MKIRYDLARPLPRRGALWGAAGVALLLVPAVVELPTRLVWNVSASVPTGLYAVRPEAPLRPGVLAAVMPPEPLATWMVEGGYLGRGVPLIKRVEALPGQRVCRNGMDVTVNGRLRALARPADRFGRPLPRWSGCVVVGEDQLFLLNADHPSSLDGRYFGPLPRSTVLGRATPLFVDDAR